MKTKVLISIILSCGLITGCQQEVHVIDDLYVSLKAPEEKKEEFKNLENENQSSEEDQKKVDNEAVKTTTEGELVEVDNPTSIEVLVNKTHKLPDGYTPSDLVVPDVPFYFDNYDPKKQMRREAATALEALFLEAEKAELDLVAASGYRSYERQEQIYNHNVATKGQVEADKFSARPGTSEHQTGLAMDVTTAEVAFALEQTFKQTDEGTWLESNAHKFGFIIRYPEGKSDITGYSYEPWHIRYVGKKIAKEIFEESITLEEYFLLEY